MEKFITACRRRVEFLVNSCGRSAIVRAPTFLHSVQKNDFVWMTTLTRNCQEAPFVSTKYFQITFKGADPARSTLQNQFNPKFHTKKVTVHKYAMKLF